MAHSLGLVVVAEGVETEQQAAELFKYRCDYIQGYLLSRPVPWEQAIDLLIAFRREAPLLKSHCRQ
jgi:EAL domain-containing protein (putative c-di-GMP-specific phosphodiesterase class I)